LPQYLRDVYQTNRRLRPHSSAADRPIGELEPVPPTEKYVHDCQRDDQCGTNGERQQVMRAKRTSSRQTQAQQKTK
jgi:hypothetical protein